MKIRPVFFVLLSVIALLIAFSIYSWPVKIQENINGITYRSNLTGYYEEMNIVIEGHYFRNLFKQNEFLGKFYIEGVDLPENLGQKENINIHFDRKGQGSLYYPGTQSDNGSGWFFVAAVYLDIRDMKVAVTLHEGVGTGSTQWGSAGGLVFAAPSDDRAEAVNITNELMKHWLKKPIK